MVTEILCFILGLYAKRIYKAGLKVIKEKVSIFTIPLEGHDIEAVKVKEVKEKNYPTKGGK